MAPNLDKVQVLCCRWLNNLLGTWLQCVQNIFDTNMSELICIIGRISTGIGDKQESKVADLAKYVHLVQVGTFQVSISVTKT